MGYFIAGKTNRDFMIKKQNFKRAFDELCKLNANNSLKGGGGGNDTVGTTDTYSSAPDKWFGWVPWNFDHIAKSFEDVLCFFGFDKDNLKYDGNGNLVGMEYESKNGDINYLLDTIAPFVEPGGKMYWKGEDGAKYTLDFSKTRPFNTKQLKHHRKILLARINLVKREINHIITNASNLLSAKDINNINKLYRNLASQLARYAVACGNKLSSQSFNKNTDMASLPTKIITSILQGFLGTPYKDSITPLAFPNQDLANETPNSACHLTCFSLQDSDTKIIGINKFKKHNPKMLKLELDNNLNIVAKALKSQVFDSDFKNSKPIKHKDQFVEHTSLF